MERLFKTSAFFDKFESNAKDNLSGELKMLG
jgi:predicted metal-dependent HD superfamily phosphohydrolase